jgi:DNA sulfur modification protein DndD
MLIRRLVLQDFGLFRGRNEILLAPRSAARSVVLIGGNNGAGKTTLLEAVRLALYGPAALGPRVSARQYEHHLRSRLHRGIGDVVATSASVELEFDYAERGEKSTYLVRRAWTAAAADTDVFDISLTVTRNGQPLSEVDESHADEFLRDLIPPGVSQLFFFDGEKIQELAENDEEDVSLVEAVRGLLGLDLVERLQSDLRIYSTRLEASPKVDPLANRLTELGQHRATVVDEQLVTTRKRDEAQSRLDRLRQQCALAEQQIAREGGVFANQYESLKSEREQLNGLIREAEDEVRDACEGLLPFTLAAPLCRQLSKQLLSEEKLQGWQGQSRLLKRRVDKLVRRLDEELFPSTAGTTAKMRGTVIARAAEILRSLASPPKDLPNVPLIHRLSEQQRQRLSKNRLAEHSSLANSLLRFDCKQEFTRIEATLGIRHLHGRGVLSIVGIVAVAACSAPCLALPGTPMPTDFVKKADRLKVSEVTFCLHPQSWAAFTCRRSGSGHYREATQGDCGGDKLGQTAINMGTAFAATHCA